VHLTRSDGWVGFLVRFLLLKDGVAAGMGGVVQPMEDEPSGFLLRGQSLTMLLTKSPLEQSPRWLCLGKERV